MVNSLIFTLPYWILHTLVNTGIRIPSKGENRQVRNSGRSHYCYHTLSFLSVCIQICVQNGLCVCFFQGLRVSRSVCLCISVYLCITICISVCLCVCISVCLCVSMSVCHCICLSVYLYPSTDQLSCSAATGGHVSTGGWAGGTEVTPLCTQNTVIQQYMIC